MQVRSGTPSASDAEKVLAHLAVQEAVNNLPFRILASAMGAGTPVFVAVAERDGALVACGVCSWAKFALGASDDLEGVQAIGREVRTALPSLPGVIGPTAESAAFLEGWSGGAATITKRGRDQRIYALDAVVPPRATPGHSRIAGALDAELVSGWWDAFSLEALAKPAGQTPAPRATDVVSAGEVLLWVVDGEAVSMARGRRATPHGGVVGPVYTQPGQRGQGYASSVVAELSQQLLDSGCRHCFLYTDLANPTSNSIYQAIGYKPVCDVSDRWLVEAPDLGWRPPPTAPLGLDRGKPG